MTILAMDKMTTQRKNGLRDLKEQCLLRGWVQALKDQLVTLEGGLLMLKGLEINKARDMRRKTHHLYVTDRRDVNAVCNEVSK